MKTKTGQGFAFTAADPVRGHQAIIITNDEQAAREIYDRLSKGESAFDPAKASWVEYSFTEARKD